MSKKIDLLNLPSKEWTGVPEKLDPQVHFERRNVLRKHVKRTFVVMFGPPFTSGVPHLGTIYAELVKDIFVSLKFNEGMRCFLRPGFDCHGLPIENLVDDLYRNMTDEGKVLKALLHIRKNQLIQVDFFKKVDIIADWKRPYMTCNPDYVNNTIGNFNLLKKMGKIKKDVMQVDYCLKTRTIVSFSEIEDRSTCSPSLWYAFDTNRDGLKILVFTTTPWSLPANAGIAYGTFCRYKVYEKDNFEIVSRTGLPWLGEPVRDFDSNEFQNIKVKNPITEEWNPVVCAEFVENKDTGLVHLAGFYDMKDFRLSSKLSLQMINIHENYPLKSFETLYDVNSQIIDALEKNVIRIEWETGLKPHFVRSGMETVTVVSKQWFLDTVSSSSKAKQLSMLNSIDWPSVEVKSYMANLIFRNNRNWCLSRNRLINTPIQGFDSLQERVTESVKREGLDVWFDSANSFTYCYDRAVDLVTEGIDQYKGYFLRSLQLHSALEIHRPMKKVISTGFVLDRSGDKLSKSKGNYLSLNKILKKWGSDVLRLWSMQSPFSKNIVFSETQLNAAKKTMKKIRNYLEFVCGYWEEIKKAPSIHTALLHPQDQWIVNRLTKFWIAYVRDSKRYKPQNCLRLTLSFLEFFSHHYLTNVKTVIYCRRFNDVRSVSILNVLKLFLRTSLIALRPFAFDLVCLINDISLKANVWDIRFGKIDTSWLSLEETKRFDFALSVSKELKPYFEKAIRKGIVKDSRRTSITLPARFKSIVDHISFFTYWSVSIGTGIVFKETMKVCSMCYRNAPKNLSISGKCIDCLDFLSDGKEIR